MGRPHTARYGTAPPKAHGTASHDRGDGRLDPVRRHRTAHGTLLRLIAVAALLVTAAAVSWSPPRSCADPRAGVAADTSRSSSATATPPRAGPSTAGPSTAGPSTAGPSTAGPADRSSATVPPGNVAASPGVVVSPGVAVSLGDVAVPPGSVGVPIRLADPTALGLVRPGNRVDLLRVGADGESSSSVATFALVLEVTDAGDPTTAGLLLALSRAEAEQAVTAPGHGFAILIRPG